MSSGLIVQFQDLKEKAEFLSLFDKFEKQPFSDTCFITFKFDYDWDGEIDYFATHMEFDTHYIKDSIHFDFRGDCLLPYYIALAISERYKTKFAWETNCILQSAKKFFKHKDKYNSDFLVCCMTDFDNRELDPERIKRFKKEDKSLYKRAMAVKKAEDRLKTELYPHFFEDYEKYVWV